MADETNRVNPFVPNGSTAPGRFVGRIPQLNALEQALIQTRAGSPKGFMLTGERGIGKTSLLRYLKFVAQGYIEVKDEKMRFLVIELEVDGETTDVGLIRRIDMALIRELGKTESARSFLSKGWEFVQRIEAFGVKIKEGQRVTDRETLHDEFAFSLATTVNRITQDDADATFGSRFDGVLLLIDEADNAPEALGLGTFIKLLSERLERHNCPNVMIGLAGMPGLREVLRASHPSSLRVVDELPLGPLSNEEVGSVIDFAMAAANKTNISKTEVSAGARGLLIGLSEGYPHFIQQFGYSAFESDTDGIIDEDDVVRGAFGPRGALEKIGDQYYRDNFYNKIQKDSYRQVLRIMAERQNAWISKEEIRAKYKGKETTLDSAIKALRERKIILHKEGERGTYRLQHRGFALWIKLFTSDPDAIQGGLSQLSLPNDTASK
jgi:hypothetical protein